ncbi:MULTISPECIES: hypothetical protein [Halobacterium]|uniref:DUF7521 family protein n=1 Tax=Halobacterium TaxID=2239 RepID=UPI00073E7CCE|nr:MULTISPECIES: hypothetical protein [Halobacterium]MCG1004526.1 hypothetical protein [Halobacterium noricense]
MTHYLTLVALKTITLALGGAVTYFALKAWKRTGSPALRSLAIGFGFVTLGSLLAGLADQVLAVERTLAVLTESALTAVGFAVIVYSLYVD